MCKASKTVGYERITISTAYVHCTGTFSTASQHLGADTNIGMESVISHCDDDVHIHVMLYKKK